MIRNDADLIVVGGGAAGLYAAAIAARRGLRVLILEKCPRPARKLMITGKGRCNVTNNTTKEKLMENIPCNPKFLYSAFASCDAQDVMRFFEAQGVELKTERGNRVFPVSDKAVDIVDALVGACKTAGAKLLTDTPVQSLVIEDGVLTGVKTENGACYTAPNVLVTCGGLSYPTTGSTGDGYRLARQAGHTIKECRGSLVALESNEPLCLNAMGLSLRNVTLCCEERGKKKNKVVYKEQGEMLFTHFGVTGPLVLSASAHIRKDPKDYTLILDLKPALSAEQLDARILRDFLKYVNKDVVNALDELLPKKIISDIIRLAGIDPQTKVHDLTKEQRLSLVHTIKNVVIPVSAFRPVKEAIVTNGGVNVKEINPHTMESKLLGGLYFAGEVIDVDAYTGGFNLQIAFATGNLAAISVNKDGSVE